MITTNTIVRNGVPFIDPVLRQVEPFVDRMLITVSENSIDGTVNVLNRFKEEFGEKVVLDTENVKDPSELTTVRQRQLDNSIDDSWILFLDADDWWSKESLENMKEWLEWDMDGLAVNPYQVVDHKYYDISWKNKWFTKWFKKQNGVHYRKPWPRDLIFKDNELLYWKVNKRVPRINVRYFHLSNIMNWKFRDESWAKEYESKIGSLIEYPSEEIKNVQQIFKHVR